jgi:hypothetical protein
MFYKACGHGSVSYGQDDFEIGSKRVQKDFGMATHHANGYTTSKILTFRKT